MSAEPSVAKMISTEDRIVLALNLKPMGRQGLADSLSKEPMVLQRFIIDLKSRKMIFITATTKSFNLRGVPVPTYALTANGLERAKELLS